jgi:hypothetical protein
MIDKKISWALFCILIIFGSNYLVEMIGRWHFSQTDTKHPFDLGHTFLPDFHEIHSIVNVIPLCLFGFVLFQSDATALLKEIFLFLVIIFFIRALTTLSTILPKHERCVEPDTLSLFLGRGCYDKIFSGHMSFVTIFSLVLLGHDSISLIAFIALNSVQALLILLTRAHYTVDILLAFVITYLVYDGDYHLFTDFFKGIRN